MSTPKELKYTKSHEWLRLEQDGSATVGITEHAQELMGDLVYVELPQQGAQLSAGKECSVVESVKAASDVYAPIAGEVVDANAALAGAPETLNQDPYGKGWMFKLKPANAADLDKLLDAAGYEKVVAEAGH